MIRTFVDLYSISGRRALFLAAAVGTLICLTPDSNPDLPMHRLIGKTIIANHSIPRTEFLSWTREGRPWIDYEWGAEVLFYAVDRIGGEFGLWALKVAGFAALMLPFVLLLRLQSLPDSWIALALFPYMLSFLPFLNVRPEIASFLFAPIELLILESTRLGRIRFSRLLAAQFVLFAIWANLHPAFPVGLLLCACYCGTAAIDRQDAKPFLALGTAALAGTLLNPYGASLYATFIDHGKETPILRAHVSEWQFPNPTNAYQAPYWVMLLFSLAILAISRLQQRKMPRAHQAVIILFSIASLTAYRQNPYLSLLVFPLALAAAYSMRELSGAIPYRFELLAVFYLLLANAGIVVLKMEGLFTRIRGTYNAENACAYLKEKQAVLSPLRMFNSWYWGSYMESALFPQYRVFMDGRFGGVFTDLLPEIDRAAATPQNWSEFLDRRRIDLAVMDRRRPIFQMTNPRRGTTSPLDLDYMPRHQWALVYWDTHAWIWVRRSAVDKDWLKKNEYQWIHPDDAARIALDLRSGRATIKQVRRELFRYLKQSNDAWERAIWAGQLTSLERDERRGPAGAS